MTVWTNGHKAMLPRWSLKQLSQVDAIQVRIVERKLKGKPLCCVVKNILYLGHFIAFTGHLHVIKPYRAFAAGQIQRYHDRIRFGGGRGRDRQFLPVAVTRDSLRCDFAQPFRPSLPSKMSVGLASNALGLYPDFKLVFRPGVNWSSRGYPPACATFPVGLISVAKRIADSQAAVSLSEYRLVPVELRRRIELERAPIIYLCVAVTILFKGRILDEILLVSEVAHEQAEECEHRGRHLDSP